MRSLRDKLSPLLGGTAASAVGAAANAAVGAVVDAGPRDSYVAQKGCGFF